MKYVRNFENFKNNNKLYSLILNELKNGTTKMIPIESIMSFNEGLVDHSDYELERLVAKKGEDLIIYPYIPEIKALVDKFANSGQSGGSAPFTSGAIIDCIKKLMNYEPLGDGIDLSEDEWSAPMFDDSYQNKRLSSVFKEGKDGDAYYIQAITFKPIGKDYGFSGSADLKDENGNVIEKIGSSHYIKDLPFIPKTFTIDVEEKEYEKLENGELVEKSGGGWWESWIANPSQLDEVFEYYNKKVRN